MSSGQTTPLEAGPLSQAVLTRFKRQTDIKQAPAFVKFTDKPIETIISLHLSDYEEIAKLIAGLFTLKLLYQMEAMGIDSPEVEIIQKLNPVGAYLGRLLAFDVIDMAAAQKECNNIQAMGVLRACRGFQLAKAPKLPKLIETYDARLEKGVEEFLKGLRATGAWPAQTGPESAAENRGVLQGLADELGLSAETLVARLRETSAQPSVPSASDQGAFILEVAESIMLTLARVNRALQTLDAEQLAQLRDLTGIGGDSNGAFSLHLALLKISGSRARAQLRSE